MMKSLRTHVIGFVLLSTMAASAVANPRHGRVVGGNATIARSSESRLDIVQHSDRAVIEWDRFDIAVDEHTAFQQPSASSIALNRVAGNAATEILGRLTANGRLFLVNPAGIVFGASSRIDVAGLVATTIDVPTADFMAGNYGFDTPGVAHSGVVNEGEITISDGGLAALVAPWTRNDGVIRARLGSIHLAGADMFTVDFHGDSLIRLAVDEAALSQALPTNPVLNSGTLEASEGIVDMTAANAVRALDVAVRCSGLANASSIENGPGGTVILGAYGGTAVVSGDLLVDGESGGDIRVSARDIEVSDEALFSASALEDGDGGAIEVVATNSATFAGRLCLRGGLHRGDGGRAEVSGANTLSFTGAVDAGAPAGTRGSLLLDPATYTIDATNVGPINGANADTTVQADDWIAVNAQINMANDGVALTLESDQVNLNSGRIASRGDLTIDGDLHLGSTSRLITYGGDLRLKGAVTATAGAALWTHTKVNYPGGANDPGDGAVRFEAPVQLTAAAGTPSFFSVEAGNGTVQFDADVSTDRIDVSSCGTFTNNGTLTVDDELNITVGTDLAAGDDSIWSSAKGSHFVDSLANGLLSGFFGGGSLEANGFGIVDIDVDLDGDLDVGGGATGQVDGTVGGSLNVPNGITGDVSAGGGIPTPGDGLYDLWRHATSSLDDLLLGTNFSDSGDYDADSGADSASSQYPSDIVHSSFDGESVYWPEDYWRLRDEQSDQEYELYTMRNDLQDIGYEISDLEDQVGDQEQSIREMEGRIQQVQTQMFNLIEGEENFADDPAAHEAWRQNVELQQQLIERLESNINSTREGIEEQLNALASAREQQELLTDAVQEGETQLREINGQMQDIDDQLTNEVDQMVEQFERESEELAALSEVADRMSAEYDAEQQAQEQEESAEQEGDSESESSSQTGGFPSGEMLRGDDLTINLDVLLESDYLFWDEPLSAEGVHNALIQELATGDSYQAGSDEAIEGLAWHADNQMAQQTTGAVGWAVVQGTMEAVGALRGVDEGLDSLIDTVEGVVEAYNDVADAVDHAQTINNQVQSRLAEEGWQSHNQVIEHNRRTITTTTYFHTGSGEYVTSIVSTPNPDASLQAGAGRDSASTNEGVSYLLPTVSTIRGNANGVSPTLIDRVF